MSIDYCGVVPINPVVCRDYMLSYCLHQMCGQLFDVLSHVVALQDNGYPERFIHSSCLPRPRPTSPAETEEVTTLTLPYLKGPSEAIRRVLEPLNIRTFFRPTRTLVSP